MSTVTHRLGTEESAQDAAITRLEREGWHFASWISAHDPGHPEHQCAVMSRKPTRHTTHYCEVNPDGSVA